MTGAVYLKRSVCSAQVKDVGVAICTCRSQEMLIQGAECYAAYCSPFARGDHGRSS